MSTLLLSPETFVFFLNKNWADEIKTRIKELHCAKQWLNVKLKPKTKISWTKTKRVTLTNISEVKRNKTVKLRAEITKSVHEN